MKQIQLKNYGVVELKSTTMKNTNGGLSWGDFGLAYFIKEVLEGFQRGVKADCETACC